MRPRPCRDCDGDGERDGERDEDRQRTGQPSFMLAWRHWSGMMHAGLAPHCVFENGIEHHLLANVTCLVCQFSCASPRRQRLYPSLPPSPPPSSLSLRRFLPPSPASPSSFLSVVDSLPPHFFLPLPPSPLPPSPLLPSLSFPPFPFHPCSLSFPFLLTSLSSLPFCLLTPFHSLSA